MLLEALEVGFDRLLDVSPRVVARRALTEAPGKARAAGDVHPVLVELDENAKPHVDSPAALHALGTPRQSSFSGVRLDMRCRA